MEKTEENKNRFGLLGRNISYSFSKGYFTKKFEDNALHMHSYENFDLEHIDAFKDVISNSSNIKGMNVTIPYKEEIIPFLDNLDKTAEKIGAVNTIKITNEGLKGYNTDAYGFHSSIKPYLKKHHKRALILGTGGASKAVAYVLSELKIDFVFVSRNPKENQLSYADLNEKVIENHSVIINCTPLGTYPKIEQKPEIPYQYVTSKHLFFDLIYNPEKSAFLTAAEKAGASICNGYQMLVFQAEKSWEIWNSI